MARPQDKLQRKARQARNSQQAVQSAAMVSNTVTLQTKAIVVEDTETTIRMAIENTELNLGEGVIIAVKQEAGDAIALTLPNATNPIVKSLALEGTNIPVDDFDSLVTFLDAQEEELLDNGISVSVEFIHDVVPPKHEVKGDIVAELITVSKDQAIFQKHKGSISKHDLNGLTINRLAADRHLGLTINFDGAAPEDNTYLVAISVQGVVVGTDLEVAAVSGGNGIIIEDRDLAASLIGFATKDVAFGMDISVQVEKIIKEPVYNMGFNPDDKPELFSDDDPIANTFLQLLWGYVRSMHPGIPRTEAEIITHQRQLVDILENILDLPPEDFAVVFVAFEEVFTAYIDTVFAERYVLRGLSQVKPAGACTRLLATLNCLRIAAATVNKDKLHLVLDTSNLHLHGFNGPQALNLSNYFNNF